MDTLIVSFNGGPGSGKSTASAQLYALLSWAGVDAELVVEYAKGKTFEGAPEKSLANQIKVFGKQHDYLTRCLGHVDVVVTDASLVNSLVYGETSDAFKSLVLSEVRALGGLHVFLDRDPAYYQTAGRTQTLEEAQEIDARIRQTFTEHGIPFVRVPGGPSAASQVFTRVMDHLGRPTRQTPNTGVEIERKWRPSGRPDVQLEPAFQIEQYYIPTGSGELRARSYTTPEGETTHAVTIKTGSGLLRPESNVTVDHRVMSALRDLATGTVAKNRYHAVAGDVLAEVDEYLDDLAGLYTVEVEFASEAEAHAFVAPEWFGDEVTGQTEYSNYALAHDMTPALLACAQRLVDDHNREHHEVVCECGATMVPENTVSGTDWRGQDVDLTTYGCPVCGAGHAD